MAYAELIEKNLKKMQKDLDGIEKPETRLKILIEMSKYVVPALSSVNVDASEKVRSSFEDTFRHLAEEDEKGKQKKGS